MRLRPTLVLILAGALAAPTALAQPKPDAPKPPAKGEPAKPDAPKADAPKGDAPKGDAPKGDPSKPDAQKDDARAQAQRLLAKQAEARMIELVKRGREACTRGDFDEGIEALSTAYSQKGDLEVGAALGACEAQAGHWASAAEHLAAVLRVKEDGAERKKLEEMFVDVRRRLGAVKVNVNVEGADVIVGDRLVGQSPLPGEVYVEPGKRTPIVAKKPGHEEAEKVVQVAAQGTAEVTLNLPVASSTGNRYAAPVRTKVPMIVLGVAALVAGGVGASLYSASFSKGSAADDLLAELKSKSGQQNACSPAQAGCDTVTDLRKSSDKLMNIGTGVFIGGGVLLGAAVLAGAWAYSGSSSSSALGPAASRTASISVAPAVSTDGGGLWLRGAF